LLTSGKVLVSGGHDGSRVIGSVEVYDPQLNSWVKRASLKEARQQHTSTLLPNGKVVVSGGVIGVERTSIKLNTVELYDSGTNTWTNQTPLTDARISHTSTLLPNGRVLIVGGLGILNSLWFWEWL
jgi:N-acetylneuraminic acid mutarotase